VSECLTVLLVRTFLIFLSTARVCSSSCDGCCDSEGSKSVRASGGDERRMFSVCVQFKLTYLNILLQCVLPTPAQQIYIPPKSYIACIQGSVESFLICFWFFYLSLVSCSHGNEILFPGIRSYIATPGCVRWGASVHSTSNCGFYSQRFYIDFYRFCT
jgi:hypothetical protein